MSLCHLLPAKRAWEKEERVKKPLAVLVCAAALGALSGCSAPTVASTQDSTVTPQTSQSAPSQNNGSSFKSGVLTTPELKISITDHKIIQPGAAGNEYGKKPVIAFWYKITNLTGQKVSPMTFIMDITAYQDNDPNRENKLNVAGLPDNRFLQTQSENIKKGGTVESAVAYELDDLKTPVDLVASVNLGLDTIGKVTYLLK